MWREERREKREERGETREGDGCFAALSMTGGRGWNCGVAGWLGKDWLLKSPTGGEREAVTGVECGGHGGGSCDSGKARPGRRSPSIGCFRSSAAIYADPSSGAEHATMAVN